MTFLKNFFSAAAVVTATTVLAVGPTDANASVVTFQLAYSGATYGNSATGSGFVSFDDAVLPNTGIYLGNVSPSTLGIVDFGITIANATIGNGSFELSDFSAFPDGWIWYLLAPLDFSLDLVGQAGFLDFNWCAGSYSCGNPSAPGGSSNFNITTNGESGETLVLTSMRVVSNQIPEPASLVLVGIGLAALALTRKRKRA